MHIIRGLASNQSGLYLDYFDFSCKSVSKSGFKKSPTKVHVIPNLKRVESLKTNLGCVCVILISALNQFPSWTLRNPQFRYMSYQAVTLSNLGGGGGAESA